MSRHAEKSHVAADAVGVLHVGSSRGTVAAALDEVGPATIDTIDDADGTLDRLADRPVDCVVVEPTRGEDTEPVERIREAYPAIPIVVLDAEEVVGSAAAVLSAGATEYVPGSDGDATALLAHRIDAALGTGCEPSTGRPAASTSTDDLLDGVPDGIYALDPDGTFRWWNNAFVELTGYDDGTLAGMSVADLVVPLTESGVARGIAELDARGGITATETTIRRADGGEVPVEMKGRMICDGERSTVVGVVRDINTRRDRRERLDRNKAEIGRQEDEVASLTRLNAIIRDLDQALMGAETRQEIERAVCSRLADSDPYTMAWIGERNISAEEIVPKAWSGIEDEAIEGHSMPVDDDNPIAETLATGHVQVAEGIEETSRLGPWTGVANEDAQFAVTIPLRYGNVPYGVLVVYTDRPFQFDERELEVLTEHGEAIGHAINTVQQKRALVTDTITEFQFRITDSDNFYTVVSGETGAAFALEGLVTQSDGSYVEYVTMTGADPDAIHERATASADIEHVRLVSDHPVGALFEFRFGEHSIATALAEHGASVQSATFEGGTGTVIGALPRSSDIRMLAETFSTSFPGAELVAQRERERSIQTQQKFHRQLEDRLTDRQHAALETAYLSGYFEWPRDSTGEEVAASLDITSPTFSKHLRVGQRKLLATLFDESPE